MVFNIYVFIHVTKTYTLFFILFSYIYLTRCIYYCRDFANAIIMMLLVLSVNMATIFDTIKQFEQAVSANSSPQAEYIKQVLLRDKQLATM